MSKFLNHYSTDLSCFLKLPQQEISNRLIKYLIDRKISKSYKNLVFSSIKHACEMNDVILNWKKLKKFIKSEKTNNETNGRDRGYTHEEIRKILDFSDQRIRTALLILASTGIRIGALYSLSIHDLEKFDDVYKITVYSGDKEEYFAFCTPEAANEIDTYLDFRKRHGEKLTRDSFLLVKRFNVNLKIDGFKGKPFGKRSLQVILEDYIKNSGLREIDHVNPHKRKEVPILHGFRKFFTTQLISSKINPEIREMLLGHKIGLASCYYRPTVEEMYEEYSKAIDNLTIDPANRLQRKIETLTIEKSRLDRIEEKMLKMEQMYQK
jgi:integrase